LRLAGWTHLCFSSTAPASRQAALPRAVQIDDFHDGPSTAGWPREALVKERKECSCLVTAVPCPCQLGICPHGNRLWERVRSRFCWPRWNEASVSGSGHLGSRGLSLVVAVRIRISTPSDCLTWIETDGRDHTRWPRPTAHVQTHMTCQAENEGLTNGPKALHVSIMPSRRHPRLTVFLGVEFVFIPDDVDSVQGTCSCSLLALPTNRRSAVAGSFSSSCILQLEREEMQVRRFTALICHQLRWRCRMSASR
jgi:hypothetical protein